MLLPAPAPCPHPPITPAKWSLSLSSSSDMCKCQPSTRSFYFGFCHSDCASVKIPVHIFLLVFLEMGLLDQGSCNLVTGNIPILDLRGDYKGVCFITFYTLHTGFIYSCTYVYFTMKVFKKMTCKNTYSEKYKLFLCL